MQIKISSIIKVFGLGSVLSGTALVNATWCNVCQRDYKNDCPLHCQGYLGDDSDDEDAIINQINKQKLQRHLGYLDKVTENVKSKQNFLPESKIDHLWDMIIAHREKFLGHHDDRWFYCHLYNVYAKTSEYIEKGYLTNKDLDQLIDTISGHREHARH